MLLHEWKHAVHSYRRFAMIHDSAGLRRSNVRAGVTTMTLPGAGAGASSCLVHEIRHCPNPVRDAPVPAINLEKHLFREVNEYATHHVRECARDCAWRYCLDCAMRSLRRVGGA